MINRHFTGKWLWICGHRRMHEAVSGKNSYRRIDCIIEIEHHKLQNLDLSEKLLATTAKSNIESRLSNELKRFNDAITDH